MSIGIYSDLTSSDVLEFLAGLSRQTLDERYRGELQERLELPDSVLRRPLREYSTGKEPRLEDVLIKYYREDAV